MLKIEIISLYPDQDIHCTNDVLGKFVYLNGECILQGNYTENIDAKLTGALSVVNTLNERHTIKRKKIADGNLYFKYKDNAQGLYESVFGKSEKSSYGNF